MFRFQQQMIPGSTNTTTVAPTTPVSQAPVVTAAPTSSPSTSTERIPILGEDAKEDDKPLYVNAKQYNRILKRRQARAKLEACGKIPKQRKVCTFVGCLCLSTPVVKLFYCNYCERFLCLYIFMCLEAFVICYHCTDVCSNIPSCFVLCFMCMFCGRG